MSVRFSQISTPRLPDKDPAERVRRAHEDAIKELRRVLREIEARITTLEGYH